MNKSRRGAFTLAEMLVVIAIIMILAALLVPTAFMAIGAAKNAALAVEIGQLDAAMKQYKVLYKAYPPSSTLSATAIEPAIRDHIRANFGRADFTASSTTKPPYGMTAAEALVFWLQGYSSNPIDPLGGTRVPLMQFDQTRLKPTRTVGGVQLYHYVPSEGQNQPYLYFHNASYGSLTYPAVAPGLGTARPYKSSATGNPYVNADSYQIISAGLDGDYGTDNANKQFPGGLNYQPGDKDNITNFSGGTLGSKLQ